MEPALRSERLSAWSSPPEGPVGFPPAHGHPHPPLGSYPSTILEGTLLSHFTPDASVALGGPEWLARRRADALERFRSTELPSESEEVWRYSGIDDFDLAAFGPAAQRDSASLPAADLEVATEIAESLGSHCAVVATRDGMVSGVVASPALAGDAITLSSARRDWTDTDAPPLLGELAWPRDAFGELHDAFLADAVIVDVAPKAVIGDPVVVVHLLSASTTDESTGAPRAAACFPRIGVRVGACAEAGVIEVFTTVNDGRALGAPGPGLVVPVAELDVDEDGRLRYANIQMLGPDFTQIALQASRVAQNGVLTSFTAGLGGRYARVRTDSDVAGLGAESALLAAYLGTAGQVHDFRTLQDHHGPRTRSELLFKGAVADEAHSVYSGLIRIARGSHGADAFQTNHNLVLSEGAHADSVPNLDIDENDVRCSHASTVGPIDEEQLYYLESRGVEPDVAERLIVLGFFSELASRAPFEKVGAFVESAVRGRLEGRRTHDAPARAQKSARTGAKSDG